ncbi:hypothetical protein [Geomicrobium sp. JCM 19055]|nr:hypothetical protein [Geomicrobium sp. JCM 19055]
MIDKIRLKTVRIEVEQLPIYDSELMTKNFSHKKTNIANSQAMM